VRRERINGRHRWDRSHPIVDQRYALPHPRSTATLDRVVFDLIEMNRQLGFRFSVAAAQIAG
jgi:hypothetical protein